MMTNQGPRVLEFNCRFGDPETQPLLMRLKTDLLDLLEAVVDDRLDDFEDRLEWDPRPAVCVVMASGGYPGNYDKGKVDQRAGRSGAAARCEGLPCRHPAGRRRVLTDGGRVLGVTALGDTLADAKRKAYKAAEKITFQGAFYRHDIADKAVRPLAAAEGGHRCPRLLPLESN